jgi:hypothetical protein
MNIYYNMMTYRDGDGPDRLRKQSELKAGGAFVGKGLKEPIQENFDPFPYPDVLREARQNGKFWAVATIRLHLMDDFDISLYEFPDHVVVKAALGEVIAGHDPAAFDDVSRYVFGPDGDDMLFDSPHNQPEMLPEDFSGLMPYLAKGLKSPHQESRIMASKLISHCLFQRGSLPEMESVLGPLIDALGDVSTVVRTEASFSLGLLGDKRAVPKLIECLGDPEPGIRGIASESLGLLKDPAAVPSLLERLNDTNASVVSDALRALGNIGDKRAIAPLKRYMLREDSDWKADAEDALWQLGVPEQELQKLGGPLSYRKKD